MSVFFCEFGCFTVFALKIAKNSILPLGARLKSGGLLSGGLMPSLVG